MKTSLSRLSIAAALGTALTLTLASSVAAAAASDAAPRGRPGGRGVTESVRAGTLLTPDGHHAITSIDRKWDAKMGFGTLNEAAVTPDGRLYTREANLSRNADGTITARGTFTDFDGRSFNYIETTRMTPGGPVATGKLIDIDGKVASYETTTSRLANQQTRRTMVISHADGTKETRVEVLEVARVLPGV